MDISARNRRDCVAVGAPDVGRGVRPHRRVELRTTGPRCRRRAILSVVLQSSKTRRLDSEINLAFVACRNNLDELRSIPFAQLAAMDGQGFDVPGVNGSPGGLQPVPGDPDGLPGQFTVVVDKTGGGKTLYRVSATVIWTGVLRRKQFVLETLIGERKT